MNNVSHTEAAGLYMPGAELEEVMEKLAPMLVDATSQISAHLGFRGRRVLRNEPSSFALIP